MNPFTERSINAVMANGQTPDEWLQRIREHRSSENNFDTLHQTLQSAISKADETNPSLAGELKEVDEKYAAEYTKAKENGGTAWPEFEKFVTQFERALTAVAKEGA